MSSSNNNQLIVGCPSTMNDAMHLNLRVLLDRGTRVQPDDMNVVTYTEQGFDRRSWTQVVEGANAIATALASKSGPSRLEIGHVVGTFMWNNARHLELYYAVPNMGCVLNPLNIRLHPKEMTFILGHAQPIAMFIDANLLPLFEAIPVSAMSSIRLFIICGDNMQSGNWKTTKLPASKCIDYEVFVERFGNRNTPFAWPLLDERSGCFLCYTSGTTGNPKGVLNSHRSTVLRMLLSARHGGGTDSYLCLPPMFHAAGWSIPWCSWMYGCKLVLPNTCRDFMPLMEIALAERCTHMYGVPTMIQGICNLLKTNPEKYESFRNTLKSIGVGGTAVPPYLVNFLWKEWGIEITHGWGMTECMPGSGARRLLRRSDLLLDDDAQTQNQLIQGTFNCGMETKLVDPDNYDALVARDGETIGELLIRGPCITESYFKNPAPEKFKDGWLITGDIVTIDPRDQMKIKDRSKDLVKSGGEWISSADMENFVVKLDAIELACVVGVPHPKWDERPIVIVQMYPGQTIAIADVLAHVASKYAKFQVPDDVLFWKEIPLTGTGKINKRLIRGMLKEQGYVLPALLRKSKL